MHTGLVARRRAASGADAHVLDTALGAGPVLFGVVTIGRTASDAKRATGRGVDAAGSCAAGVYCAGVAVIAVYGGVRASAVAVASVRGAKAGVVARVVDAGTHAVRARVAVVTLRAGHGFVDTLSFLTVVDSTGVVVVAVQVSVLLLGQPQAEVPMARVRAQTRG
jgi:hypothetical protein